jgi:hypothetical protein
MTTETPTATTRGAARKRYGILLTGGEYARVRADARTGAMQHKRSKEKREKKDKKGKKRLEKKSKKERKRSEKKENRDKKRTSSDGSSQESGASDPEGGSDGVEQRLKRLFADIRAGLLATVEEKISRRPHLASAVEPSTRRLALHEAAAAGHYQLCLLLLRRNGAALEAVDTAGNTPLLLAAMSKHWPVATMLVDKGANPHAQNQLAATAETLGLGVALSAKAEEEQRRSEHLARLSQERRIKAERLAAEREREEDRRECERGALA